MWKDNKITGIGLNNFTSVCKYETKYKKYNQNFGCTSHPHNIYIQVLVETGVIGLIIFSIIIIYLFIKIYRVINFDLKFILISAYLSIFWPVMSTGSILKNWNMVFISFVLSLIIVISDNKNILKEYFK